MAEFQYIMDEQEHEEYMELLKWKENKEKDIEKIAELKLGAKGAYVILGIFLTLAVMGISAWIIRWGFS